MLKGTLIARFYYIYGIDYDRGGEWSGQAFMCTGDKGSAIKGPPGCRAPGFPPPASPTPVDLAP